MKHLTTFIFILLCLNSILSQKKVLGTPIVYQDMSYELATDSWLESTYKQNLKKNKIPWLVFVDRENITTSIKPQGNSSYPFEKLEYKDSFYVIDEQNEYIKIAKVKLGSGMKIMPGSLKNYGWVLKKDMLLWRTGLITKNTGISRKAFLLNRAEDLDYVLSLDSREAVKIFKGPNSHESIGNKSIYEFYFIAKYEKNRVLLVKDFRIFKSNSMETIVGWVRKSRISEWNTRVCLEPNYSDEAYSERKNNHLFQIRAYKSETVAKEHSVNGVVGSDSETFWSNDPVNLTNDKKALSNNKRFKGAVMRFPLLKDNYGYYSSGMIGEIKAKTFSKQLETIGEVEYSAIIQKIQNQKSQSGKYNVFFLIEGSPLLNGYKNTIIEISNNLQSYLPNANSIKVGAAFYRDSKDYIGSGINNVKSIEISPLSAHNEKFGSFITGTDLNKQSSTDKFRAFYWGIKQSILRAGFDRNHTNILVLIGANGDFSADYTRRKRAQEDKVNMLIKRRDVVEKLSEIQANIISIQLYKDDNLTTSSYITQNKNLITDNATIQNNIFRNSKDYFELEIRNPSISTVFKDNITNRLNNGPNYSSISSVKGDNEKMNTEQFKEIIEAELHNVNLFSNSFWQDVNEIVNDGGAFDQVSMGGAYNGFGVLISNLLEKSNQWSQADIKKLIHKKYKLYAEIFLPKHVKGAKNETFSYVLFMPEKELEDYIKQLDYLEYCASDKDPVEQRECLFNTLLNITSKYVGDKSLNLKDISLSELSELLEGISLETNSNLFSKNKTMYIADLKSKRKVSDQIIRKWIDNILRNKIELKKMYDQKENYEFSFSERGNLYYWVPIEYTL